MTTRPQLSLVVVSWNSEDDVEALCRELPADPRFERVVVDNGSRRRLALPADVRLIEPGKNLGFAGGSNLGAREARAPLLLFLNPDARVDGKNLEALLRTFESRPDVAGLAPRMIDSAGRSLHRWALRRLPRAIDLLRLAAWTEPSLGAATEPPAGTPVEQPAAAAWALRREAFDAVGGFDESFHPAWFEDVDLARRLHQRSLLTRYAPQVTVRHGVGASVSELGFARFLWLHDRSLVRYARKHHGAAFAGILRVALVVGATLRFGALALRTPGRAHGRAEAARAYAAKALGAASGFRRPRRFVA
jgi:GT2 family glycosyltransferase